VNPIDIRLLGPDDAHVLLDVAEGVFDFPVDPHWTAEFFAGRRHHLIVALDGSRVVGMITAVDYVHPDKAPQLWIDEVGVAPSHQRLGVGRRLLEMSPFVFSFVPRSHAWCGAAKYTLAPVASSISL
jgi:GNAT superfamily N-acetyltransferase